jgi:hypothetical protein
VDPPAHFRQGLKTVDQIDPKDKKWPDDGAMQNRDNVGVAHYPGWSLPVLKLLYEERKPEQGSGFPARVVAIVP